MSLKNAAKVLLFLQTAGTPITLSVTRIRDLWRITNL